MKKVFFLFIGILTLLYAQTVQAEEACTYYISPTGSNSNDGLSPEGSFKTIDKALDYISPGDTLMFMPGLYSTRSSAWRNLMNLSESNSGEEGRYITFKAYDKDNRPVFYVNSSSANGLWGAVEIEASWIVIDGFEVMGDNSSGKLDSVNAAKLAQDFNDKITKDFNAAAPYNTNGISIGPIGNGSTAKPHHVIIRNCVIHDMPGGGVGASHSDYLTIENNIIYNNSWFTMYACSGISLIDDEDYDDNTTDYKMIIRGNRCYNNHTKVRWYGSSNFRYSDGNGIIIDMHNARGSYPGYNGRMLIVNNLSWGNGGHGIQVFKTNHVDVINNTTWNNSQRYPNPANTSDNTYCEIYSNQGKNCLFANNISYARKDGYNNLRESSCTYRNNVYYQGEWTATGTDNVNEDPLFIDAKMSLDADFHLRAGSPAIGHGSPKDYFPENDLDGNPRTMPVDCGCYQMSGVSGMSAVSVVPNSVDDRIYTVTGIRLTSNQAQSFKGVVICSGKKYLRK